MWDFFRNLFKNSEHKPKSTEPVKTNFNEGQVEIGPKEGMPENYWQEKIDKERLPINENPEKAEGRSIGDLDKMENASTVTGDSAVRTIEDDVKQKIDEREGLFEQEGIKQNETPSTSITESEKIEVIDEPDTDGGAPFLGGGSSGSSGGGSTPGRDLDDINEDSNPDEPDDLLSKNREQFQNPVENTPEQDAFAILKENSNSFLQPERTEKDIDFVTDEEKEDAFALLASNDSNLPIEVTKDLDLPEYLKKENMLVKETVDMSDIEEMEMGMGDMDGDDGGADGGGEGGGDG